MVIRACQSLDSVRNTTPKPLTSSLSLFVFVIIVLKQKLKRELREFEILQTQETPLKKEEIKSNRK